MGLSSVQPKAFSTYDESNHFCVSDPGPLCPYGTSNGDTILADTVDAVAMVTLPAAPFMFNGVDAGGENLFVSTTEGTFMKVVSKKATVGTVPGYILTGLELYICITL